MSSYSDQNPSIAKTNMVEATNMALSHIPWFYPGRYLPIPKPTTTTSSFNFSQLTRANPSESIIVPAVHMFPSVENSKNEMEPVNPVKQKPLSKPLKPKPPRKKHSASKKTKKTPSLPEAKREKKNPDINIDISNFDFSGIPSPMCSCTGVPRVCYKWGLGGWQSSCCTISVSMYPLPMSTTRPGARLAGRKMSNGAYVKLLLKLAGEGYDLSHPVDLKSHWARHGTNKFVTIK